MPLISRTQRVWPSVTGSLKTRNSNAVSDGRMVTGHLPTHICSPVLRETQIGTSPVYRDIHGPSRIWQGSAGPRGHLSAWNTSALKFHGGQGPKPLPRGAQRGEEMWPCLSPFHKELPPKQRDHQPNRRIRTY
jgi:hypothetical protein